MEILETALAVAFSVAVGSVIWIYCTANTIRVFNGDRTLKARAWFLLGVALMGWGIGEILGKIIVSLT